MVVQHQKNQKEVKFVQKVKLGLKELLIPTPLLMLTWLLQNIVKIRTMQKKQKVVKERVGNG